MNFLLVIIEELLPFVRGPDLLSLALTNRYLHERIFQSKQWKALPLIKDLYSGCTWNYGILKKGFWVWSTKTSKHNDSIVKYFETGLPIEIRLHGCDCTNLLASNPLWLHLVTSIEMITMVELKKMMNRGLLLEKLKHVGLRRLNIFDDILLRLTQLTSLKLNPIWISIEQFDALSNLKKLKIENEDLDCYYLKPLKSVTTLIIRSYGSIMNTFALSEWKNLKNLDISARTQDISFLEFLDELESFYFYHIEYGNGFIKFPSNPPKKLKKLRLQHVKNLNWLSGWTLLENIYILAYSVLNIDALETCVNLKIIHFNCLINHLNPLANCLNLVELYCLGCIKDDWESLSKLPNLEIMKANGSIPENVKNKLI